MTSVFNVPVIVVNHNGGRYLDRCLSALAAQTVRPRQAILIDNASTDGSVDSIQDRFPWWRVIHCTENLGFAAANNLAVARSEPTEWLALLNPDAFPAPGWLEELLLRATCMPDVGAVCCKVVFPNRRLQFSGGFIRHFDEELIELGLCDRDRDAADLASAEFRECDWCPIGATLFTVNPGPFLHEGYPNAFEDAGVSMALRRRGLRLLNSPASWVWHEHFLFQGTLDMQERYVTSRYDPRGMLTSIASFYAENGLIIRDEYVWRENGLFALSRDELKRLLAQQRTAA